MRKCKILGALMATLLLVMLLVPTTLMAQTTTITPKGACLTIQTEGGKAVLVDGKTKYAIDANTDLYLTKATTIYLKNSAPAYLNSINAGNGSKNVCFSTGTGTLNIENTVHEHGINVASLKICGNVTINASGLSHGVKAHGSICMTKGTLKARGTKYGVWANCGVEVCGAYLEGYASNPDSTGVWGNSGCYSIKAYNGTIIGEGGSCGVWGSYKVYACAGGTIHGISNNLNSGISAVYSGKYIYATGKCCGKAGSTIIEQYRNSGIELNSTPLVINEKYAAVGRNMAKLTNYAWKTTPVDVVGIKDGGLVANGRYEFNSSLIGTRGYSKAQKGGCCGVKNANAEPVFLQTAGCQHIVIFDNLQRAG